ncbi:B3/B4 domain-containing protein [Sulfuracidifex metallicus]|uniref:B3/B4 domain-containing protein n=1 Tax=Sulfuracidifex metallicus TaxID=47303 RepID=UPI002273C471|nr:phenylalanine--tRNA ligase beta subunit-related protein [Sulfuracidifex metallicus]MCY0849884.1 phenylalanine--tRNA ligase beta subunit-related protein [Sulfuracidifex metallicus]
MKEELKITIDPAFKEKGGFIAYSAMTLKNLKGVFDPVKELNGKVKGDVETLKDDPIVRAYRDFYWKIGIDPTKTRPSGEALRRRYLRGLQFPRINDLVDIGNVVSTLTLVPIGIYDIRFVEFPLTLTISRDDVFSGIGKKDQEKLPDGVPIMKDNSGKVLHVFPHRDSRITSVRDDTTSALIVGAGVQGVSPSLVTEAVDSVVFYIEKFLMGKRLIDTVVLT